MQVQKYAVNQYPIQTLLSWVKTDDIAIPEIQRPFVWDATKVRDFLDSLYKGYPVGYVILWRNPKVRLKTGKSSEGKRIVIDGQQRMTALMAALLGSEVIDQDYGKIRIRIAFNPLEKKFEVSNPAIQKDSIWIGDISEIFSPDFKIWAYVNNYCEKNTTINQDSIFECLGTLLGIVNNPVGVIELNSDLSIETVTEIFIRINSQGVELSQADFAMSKIAVNEIYGGHDLRKAIDYFCHLAVNPEFYDKIRKVDHEFTKSEFFQKMAWLKNDFDDIYDPSYTDLLRVAFISEFERGRLQDLVALLSGRNFETKQYEEEIAAKSFQSLKEGILSFMNETNFKRFIMIIKSAGFIDSRLIGSQNSLDFAYVVFLLLRSQEVPAENIESWVRRWFVMSMLTGRYSAGSPESAFDYDIRQIKEQGFEKYATTLEEGELSASFWDSLLPQEMNTSVTSSPYFRVFQAAQVKMNDKGFLSRDISVMDLILNKSDVHHIFPKNHLKKMGLNRGQYNQIANYAIAQSEINIAIGHKAPSIYFSQLMEQSSGGKRYYGAITSPEEMKANFAMHCIPEGIELKNDSDYTAFLETRRRLMAQKIKKYYFSL